MSSPGTPPTPPTPLPGAPGLDGAAFERAFPFHLWLDAELRVRAMGASLRKALPELRPGEALDPLFEVRRPAGARCAEDWRRHGQELCTLVTRAPARPLTLRGNAEQLADGSLLLLLTPVITSLEALRSLGLSFDDFACHDGAGEMLMLARTTQTSVADSLRMAERLRRRTAVLDGILELSLNGVLAFDAGGLLQHANTAVLQLTGLRREQLSRRSLAEVQALLAGRLEAGQEPLPELQALDAEAPITLRLARPRPRVLELRSRRAPDGSRILYLRDMTAAYEIDRMKSEFLTTAAHELRTPMASIFGFAELLLHRPVGEPRRREALQAIHRQSALLVGMLGELLDLARIEARQGKDLQCEQLELLPLLHETVLAVNAGLAQPRVRLLDPAVPHTVRVDGAKTRRALTNVLSNALRFSADTQPVVVDLLVGWAGDGAAVGVRVTDAGVGMTAHELAHCCERFWRGDPSGHHPGSGLGLSLAKEIVELQGGRLDLASQPAVGTTVTLWLPLVERPAIARAEPACAA